MSNLMMCHFDPNLPVRFESKAFPYDIEAVIYHVVIDGTERPIIFASGSLSKIKKNNYK